MKIKTKINGQEIIGYWNGKFYDTRQEDNKVRIYINGKEYIVDKDSFEYEEIFTEKQIAYAKDLKNKFLEKLELLLYRMVDEDIMKKIITYFKKLKPEWYLKNKDNLGDILNIAYFHPVILSKIVGDDNLLNEFEVVEKLGLDDKTKNEIVKKLALKSVLEYSNMPIQFVIKEKNGKYRVVVKGKIDTIIFIIDKDLKKVEIERVV